jgi:LAO/AO transport system kinase
MLAPAFHTHQQEVPIIKTIASQKKGISELWAAIDSILSLHNAPQQKAWLFAERAYQLIQNKRMTDIDKKLLKEKIQEQLSNQHFNLYHFINQYL